ncbi:MAG: hypothetical protein AAF696_23380 [Bacteroidota bacterium]
MEIDFEALNESEDNSRQELEDLLIEARKESIHTKMTRLNLRMILAIGILALANVIMFPFDFSRDRPDDPDGFFVGMVIQVIFIPLVCLPLSLIFSLFKFAPWSYLNRLYRSFLIFTLILSILLTLVLILSLNRII